MILVNQKVLLLCLSVFFFSCTAQKQVRQSELQQNLINDTALTNAFVGIAVYDTDTKQFIHQHNSNKYFVPASNTKIPTLYAGLKYLGEKLPGIQYKEQNDTLYLQPTGDPTFLHIDYKQHPVFDFLKQQNKPMVMNNHNWKTEALGFGWAWDDYASYYMTERSPMPVYGNYIKWIQQRTIEERDGRQDTSAFIFTDPEVNWDVQFKPGKANVFDVTRTRTENKYTIIEGKEMKRELEVPFVTNGLQAALELLKDTLHTSITTESLTISELNTVYSQPVDSMFKPLMHRSDNFFAEQTLMMVSNQLFGEMDEQKLIAHLLQNELSGFPQKPKWVDGSGLSRYNLFTPEDFVWLLGKMKDEFGLERLKTILPTGNTGTLRNYYKDETGLIFAKTGSLSGHLALSGFLITPKNKLLIFSVLVNNHYTSPVAVRRAVEKFLQQVRREN
ncbi:D-alanyl-D-alanine carboxypeptidase/D-alanyl-D-alanine-endopeptidase [Lacibacter sp. H407]|uniref:D-alanyl-D-alanine carboxypeptidase/D-alanyl-D-alanine-endopeptidase n=1 Tax=Lacibacter sp. H407 TaxID=3133423 RepID=UPI0030C40598